MASGDICARQRQEKPSLRESSLKGAAEQQNLREDDDCRSICRRQDDISDAANMELLYLAHEGDLQGMKSLLDRGVDVNFTDFDDRTALHVAACEGNAEIVYLLIRAGANLNARDRWGSTPLTDALHYQNIHACKILVNHGAVVNEKVSIQLQNLLGIPEYEVNPAELKFSEMTVSKKGYRVAIWRGIQVFVKCLKENVLYSEKNLVKFRSELFVIHKLRHPNIVQFLGAVTQTTPVMIIFEYLPQGDLHDFLQKKHSLWPTKAIEFGLDIARGMNYLHEHKPDVIIHRNLKPKNILRDESGHLKVADLGLSKVLKSAAQTVSEDGVHPLKGSFCRYMAPEVFTNAAYGPKVDVFAFGLILQEMIEGVQPMHEMANEEVPVAYAESNMRPPFKSSTWSYPGDLKRLIEECWDTDPEKRPTFMHVIDRLERIKTKCSKSSFWKVATFIGH